MAVSLAEGEVAAAGVCAGAVVIADVVAGVAADVFDPAGSGLRALPHAESATVRPRLTRLATRAPLDGLVVFPIRSSRAVSTGTPKKSCHHIDVQGRKAVDRNSPGRLRIVQSPANPTLPDLTRTRYPPLALPLI